MRYTVLIMCISCYLFFYTIIRNYISNGSAQPRSARTRNKATHIIKRECLIHNKPRY